MHFYRKKYDQQMRNVILVLCAKLGPVWVKGRKESAIRVRKISLTSPFSKVRESQSR